MPLISRRRNGVFSFADDASPRTLFKENSAKILPARELMTRPCVKLTYEKDTFTICRSTRGRFGLPRGRGSPEHWPALAALAATTASQRGYQPACAGPGRSAGL